MTQQKLKEQAKHLAEMEAKRMSLHPVPDRKALEMELGDLYQRAFFKAQFYRAMRYEMHKNWLALQSICKELKEKE